MRASAIIGTARLDWIRTRIDRIDRLGGWASTLVFGTKNKNDDGDFLDAGEFTTTGNVDVVENPDGSFTVTGMDTNKNHIIRYDTVTPHDMARIDYVAGSYNIGGFNLIQSVATPDQK